MGRVRVQLNGDGMTIANPGGFIEGINAENLLDADRAAQPAARGRQASSGPHGRNAALADAMKRICLAERTGRGIDRIYEGSLLNGRLLPDYSLSAANRVTLFIPKGPIDEAFIRLVSEAQKRMGRSLPVHLLLALNALKDLSNPASAREVADYTKTEESRARLSLETLLSACIIKAEGEWPKRRYLLP